MVVIALTSHNLHLDSPRVAPPAPSPADNPSGKLLKPTLPTRRSSRVGLLHRETEDEEIQQGYEQERAAQQAWDRKGKGREVEPILVEEPAEVPTVIATPPRQPSPVATSSPVASSSKPMPIPPPPTPRRHRSGVLLSRVRAQSGPRQIGSNLTMSASKSWGDLMGDWAEPMTALPVASEPATPVRKNKTRMASESSAWLMRSGPADGWDNSARFYHHHPSRSSSRSTSPTRNISPPLPIYSRRNLAPSSVGIAVSPNHQFLQAHLPPTFPSHLSSSPGSPENEKGDQARVILTPTTQEWRELKAYGRSLGDDVPGSSSDASSSESEEDHPTGHQALGHQALQLDGLPPPTPSSVSRPQMPRAHSAEVMTPELDSDAPAIIAPVPAPAYGSSEPPSRDGARSAPPVLQELELWARLSALGTLSGEMESVPRIERPEEWAAVEEGVQERSGDLQEALRPALGDDLVLGQAPSTIGRSQSMKEPGAGSELGTVAGTGMTRRERERQRLFKLLGDEMADEEPESSSPYAVTQIGMANNMGAQVSITAPSPVKAAVKFAAPSKPSPLAATPLSATDSLPSPLTETHTPELSPASRMDSIRSYARALSSHHSALDLTKASDASPPRSPRRRDTSRISLVAGRIVQPFAFPPTTAMPPGVNPHGSVLNKKPSLQSFSPFRSPALGATSPKPSPIPPSFQRFDSTISFAPSVGAPSECGTPVGEVTGGVGGRGISDYVILSEAGKGAYGLVMRAKVKGPDGEPMGDEVIIKYIIKSRILADCWKKHRALGPIPVELHVMDQLRQLSYEPPETPPPWDPGRAQPIPATPGVQTPAVDKPFPGLSPTAVYTHRTLKAEVKEGKRTGHPNICKLLDFFEDKEFYYMVMPRFGVGVDLFDRVESEPLGLQAFEIRSLLGQLADGVAFLHANSIVHRDIKDENVILDGKGRAQLIDFGSAAHWRPGKRWDTFSGTLHYASPEILRGDMYGGKEQDIWALGVVAYVLLCGETPFTELPDEVMEGLAEGTKAAEALKERCADGDEVEADGGGGLADAADLVRQCLQIELGDRPPADALLRHRFLQGSDGWTGKRGWLT